MNCKKINRNVLFLVAKLSKENFEIYFIILKSRKIKFIEKDLCGNQEKKKKTK